MKGVITRPRQLNDFWSVTRGRSKGNPKRRGRWEERNAWGPEASGIDARRGACLW